MKHAGMTRRMVALLVLGVMVCSGRAQQPGNLAQSEAARQDVARFAGRVQEALAKPGAGSADWGVLVADAVTGEILYARNAKSAFLPASNAKLFTTALALATLGPEYRVRTTIEATGGVDRLGRVAGDLVLVGRGDANLSNRVFPFTKKVEREGSLEKILAQLADQVAARGVKQIDGDVVADDSDFGPARFPSGWTVDDTVWSYGAAVSAIAVNDNAMTLEVRPGPAVGAPLRAILEPDSGYYQVRSESATTAVGSQAQLRLSRDPESRVFVVSGSLPLGAAPRPLVVGVPEPAENAAALLARLLQERGVRIMGRARAQHAPVADAPAAVVRQGGARAVLAEHVSPPLLEDVRATNKMSLNLHAELMLRVAAKEKGGAASLDDALAFASRFWQGVGVAAEDVQLSDGSGLSRNDLVTPQSVVQVLEYAARQSWGADFMSTLPVAGEDGTLEERMKGTAAAGRVHAKTGYVNHASALSGYATTVRGERLVFSMFGNYIGTRGRDATAALDDMCVAMVEELGPAAPSAGINPPAQ